jgi:hypothetical protein
MKKLKTVFLGFTIILFLSGFSVLFAQTSITVDASTVLLTIPPEIYGNNMAPWVSTNNGNTPDTTYVEAMQVSGCRNMRWPGGSWADQLNWDDIQCKANYEVTTPEYISFLQEFGGSMHPICNFSGNWCGAQNTHSQAVALAAQWVTWNLTNAGTAKAKYWDIGNEDYGSWEQGNTNGTDYGRKFADYYTAMKAVDPTIMIGAVACPVATEYNGWTPQVLTAAAAAGVVPDFLIIHNYPGPSSTGTAADDVSLVNLALPGMQKTNLDNMVYTYLGTTYVGQVKYYMDEFNINGGPSALTNEYINAMFCSQWILECAKYGWIGANLWATKNSCCPDFGFINTGTDAPFPNYYIYPMLTGKFGNTMVSCTSSETIVRAYAAIDSSGDLTIFMVNNDPDNSNPAVITLSGFNPAASGSDWVMLPSGTSASGAPQEAPDIQINGIVNPAPAGLASIAGQAQAVGVSFTVNLLPSEMNLLVIPPYRPSPTPTPICSPTITPTPTISNVFVISNELVYPDPIQSGKGTLHVRLDISQPPQSVRVKIYTFALRLIMDKTWQAGSITYLNGRSVVDLSMSELGNIANGMYYYIVTAENGEGKKATSEIRSFVALK